MASQGSRRRAVAKGSARLTPAFVSRGPIFYSHGDEKALFDWLESIPAVRRVGGSGWDIHIILKRSVLSQRDARELRAVFQRYGLKARLRRLKLTGGRRPGAKRS